MADSQMVGAGQGALSGAAAGAMVGGVPGAVIGGLGGAALGYLGSDTKGYSLPWDQYNARLGQIADYSNQLAGATSQYATAIGNMYNTAYNQYLPNAAAAFAGRGLNVDSGAFGAELGRTAAMNTASMTTDVAKMNISNIDKVQGEYGNAWASMFGAANASNKSGFDNANANMAGIGQAAVGIGKLGLMGYNGQSGSGPTTGNPFMKDYAGVPSAGAGGGSVVPGYLGPSW
jgi:hypothetical protein